MYASRWGLSYRLFSGPVFGRAELHKGDAVEDNIDPIGETSVAGHREVAWA